MELNELEKIESFIAIRSFLKTNDLFKGCKLKVELVFQNESMRHPINEIIEICYIELNAIYTISCNSFYSYQLRSPLWSSYQLFHWDASKEILYTDHDKYRVTIKRT